MINTKCQAAGVILTYSNIVKLQSKGLANVIQIIHHAGKDSAHIVYKSLWHGVKALMKLTELC
jgi:hypothetical protein